MFEHLDGGKCNLGLEIVGERVGPQQNPGAAATRTVSLAKLSAEIAASKSGDVALGRNAGEGLERVAEPPDPKWKICKPRRGTREWSPLANHAHDICSAWAQASAVIMGKKFGL